MVGIRGHYIQLLEGPAPDGYQVEVVDTIEDTFEYTLLLRRPGTTGEPLHYMRSKELPLPQGTLWVRLPPDALMLLR
jgi:hypothetical protein